MRKLFIFITIFCLLVGLRTVSSAQDIVSISGEIRVEYDHTMKRDTAGIDPATGLPVAADATDVLSMERAIVNIAIDPGGSTTGAVVLRSDNNLRTTSATGLTRANFYAYNAYIKHAMMDNQLALTLGRFNLHMATVYGLCGPHTYSYRYFTRERKDGAMLTYSPMPALGLNLAVIDQEVTEADARTDELSNFDLFFKGTYQIMEPLSVFLNYQRMPAIDTTSIPAGDHTWDAELGLGVKYKMDKLQATLEYYQEMLDSVEDADGSIINIGGSYQVTDQIKPAAAIEIIDDGNDLDDGNPSLNIIVAGHYQATENLMYSIELVNTTFEDVGNESIDAETQINLRARLTF